MHTDATIGFVHAPEGGVVALGVERIEAAPGIDVPGAQAARALTAKAPEASLAGGSAAQLIAPDTWWVGASDKRLALFENAYPLSNGAAYNSYVILDEKVVLVDTIDRAVAGQFFENLSAVLDGRDVDYVVVNHMEPDHSASLGQVLERWPQAQVICTGLAAKFIGQFFSAELRDRCIAAAEGDVLVCGRHALTFVEAPWVHWPEVMMSFDAATGVLFSADAFGTFGALDGHIFADQVDAAHDPRWLAEARRYYSNIVGKYGPYVRKVLDKAAGLDIAVLAPTHGPVWRHDLGWILGKYAKWAAYEPEDRAVAIFCASVYGGTENAATMLATQLSAAGVNDVRVYDVSKAHVSELVAEAFRCSHLVFASVTYNNGMFSAMRDLLADLAEHHLADRRVSFIENGTWHANSGKLMREAIEAMPGMVEVGEAVSLRSAVAQRNVGEIDALAKAIAASLVGDASVETQLSEPIDTATGASHH